MKSLNIKRAAAIASGLAMVGSVIAPGFAAVTVGDGVSGLASTMASNLDQVQCVVGTNGASVTDGLQCAKIAATLTALNYKPSTGTMTADMSPVSIKETGDKSVNVETTGSTGTLATSTSSKIVVEMDRTANGLTNYTSSGGYVTDPTNKTITSSEFSDVLNKRTINAVVNDTSSQYTYEEKIWLTDVKAAYLESGDNTYPEHGLYLFAPQSTTDPHIEYGIEFTGTGLPIGSGYDYSEVPSITLFGKSFGLNTAQTSNTTVKLYTGSTVNVNSGETAVNADGVSIDFVTGSETSNGGTIKGTFKVSGTLSDGTDYEFTTSPITSGNDYTYTVGDEEVTVTAQYLGKVGSTGYTATVRVGTSTISLTEGSPVPETFGDSRWSVSTITGENNHLTKLAFVYGNTGSTDRIDAGKWDLTSGIQYQLPEGTLVHGPKDLGTGSGYLFDFKLAGFGSKTTQVDTTTLKLTGEGSEGDNQYIKAEWVSRDGVSNTFAPSSGQYAIFATNSTNTTTLNLGGSRTTITNDKVVYLESIDVASSGKAKVKLRIGGSTGELVTLGEFDNATGASLSNLDVYTSSVNPIKCTVTVPTTTTVKFTPTATQMSASSDSASGLCDLYPDVVPIGNYQTITKSDDNVPYIDMRFAADNNNQNITSDGSKTRAWPFVSVYEPENSEAYNNFTAVYDPASGKK